MSSSCGSRRARAADIIDLDRYMRSAVKPYRDYRTREHFVVDAGGVDRAPRAPLSSVSDSSAAARPPPGKRFSHDSGLSDDSYVRRRPKAHRRGPEAPLHSSPSVVQFRRACEQALHDQQLQISRVTQLCERLVQPAPPARDTDSSDSSDASSSSRGSVPRHRDKRKTDSCKTYKIIMCKLDELGQLLAARRAPRAPPPAASSRSVSVCDKLVATEPLAPLVQTVVVARCEPPARDVGAAHAPAGDGGTRGGRSQRSTPPLTYDLEDPVHLFEQAKRLQHCERPAARYEQGDRSSAADSAQREEPVCAACRYYWRALRRCMPLLFAPPRSGAKRPL